MMQALYTPGQVEHRKWGSHGPASTPIGGAWVR